MLTHGGSKTREYRIWAGMLYRCDSPGSRAFKNYGARGISVCERWRLFEVQRETTGVSRLAAGLIAGRITLAQALQLAGAR